MVDRIKQIMEYKRMTPASFAEAIEINRSNLTHLFSGRNQPSLDLAKKILHAFPEISTEWLIMGVGKMLKIEEEIPSEGVKIEDKGIFVEDLFSQDSYSSALFENENTVKEEEVKEIEVQEKYSETKNIQSEVAEPVVKSEERIPCQVTGSISPSETHDSDKTPALDRICDSQEDKKVKKIVFFYVNNTFETFYPAEIEKQNNNQ